MLIILYNICTKVKRNKSRSFINAFPSQASLSIIYVRSFWQFSLSSVLTFLPVIISSKLCQNMHLLPDPENIRFIVAFLCVCDAPLTGCQACVHLSSFIYPSLSFAPPLLYWSHAITFPKVARVLHIQWFFTHNPSGQSKPKALVPVSQRSAGTIFSARLSVKAAAEALYLGDLLKRYVVWLE